MGNGFSHVGVSTHDMEATIRFYSKILGFPRVGEDRIRVKEGGSLRQVSFDVGEGQYMVFMESKGVHGIPADYDTGINGALGVPRGMYHFALRVPSLDALVSSAQELERCGIEVSPIIDLETAKSVFFLDPNGIQLELCYQTRPFNECDLHRESEASIAIPG